MRGLKARQGVALPPVVAGALWVPLTQGKFALVDTRDGWVLSHPWCYGKTWHCEYASRRVDGKKVYMHRELLGLAANDKVEVDHRDGNGLNNRRDNLRLATHQQNLQNQRPRGGSSKYRGVFWDKSKARWKASIRLGARRFWLGSFSTELEAAVAYNRRAKELFGDRARLNHVQEACNVG